MCDCKDTIEEKLASRHVEKTGAASAKASLEGYGLSLLAGRLARRAFLPYTIKSKHKAKDGSMKQKTTKGNMLFSFCPFCGERTGANDA